MGGIDLSNLVGCNAGPYECTGNLLIGDGSTGGVNNGISVVSEGGVTSNVVIEGNNIYNFGTEVKIWPGSKNVRVDGIVHST